MGVLDRLMPGKTGGKVHTTLTELARTTVYTGVFAGLGFTMKRWPDKAKLGPLPADLALGLTGTGLGLLGTIFGVGKRAQPWLYEAGRLGAASFGLAMGAAYGAGNSDMARLILPKKDVKAALKAVPSAKVVFAGIPPAPDGDWLSKRDLDSLKVAA